MKKINLSKKEEIQKVLEEVQKRASVRIIDVDDIYRFVFYIEKRFEKILYKKDWKGGIIHVDINAQNFSNAYKGIPESTQFDLIRGSSSWFVSGIKREICKPQNQQFIVKFTEDQKSKMVDFITKNFL
jgi:hypothetical protein